MLAAEYLLLYSELIRQTEIAKKKKRCQGLEEVFSSNQDNKNVNESLNKKDNKNVNESLNKEEANAETLTKKNF